MIITSKILNASILSALLAQCMMCAAFPGYDPSNPSHLRSLQSAEGSNCPMNQIGTDLETANEDAIPRLAAWEEAFPAGEYGRKYTVGSAGPGEVYCDGAGENKFCNKINGPWGDSIPQNGTYCLWGMLEFQDPLEIEFGKNMSNTDRFLGIFFDTLNTLFALENASDAVMAIAATTGAPFPDPRFVEEESSGAPWPVASIVWRDGNKVARDWIIDTHRPRAQLSGYGIGFTFRGHYKAVQCDAIPAAWAENNITREENFNPDTGGLVLNINSMIGFWNAFADMEDESPAFAVDECVVECTVGPCPDMLSMMEDDDDTAADGSPTTSPTNSPNDLSSGGSMSSPATVSGTLLTLAMAAVFVVL